MKIPRIDMVNPPMVPAASGNQNASLSGPNMNGINPSMVEITVRKIGVILAFHAFRYNRQRGILGLASRNWLNSFSM